MVLNNHVAYFRSDLLCAVNYRLFAAFVVEKVFFLIAVNGMISVKRKLNDRRDVLFRYFRLVRMYFLSPYQLTDKVNVIAYNVHSHRFAPRFSPTKKALKVVPQVPLVTTPQLT